MFWEYKNYSFVNKLFFFALQNDKYKKLRHMMVFYLNLHNKKSSQFRELNQFLNLNENYLSLSHICNQKIIQLKKRIIFGDTSFFDILNMSFDSLANLLSNREIFIVCSKLKVLSTCKETLSVYLIMILEKISLAMERRTFLDVTTSFLKKVIDPVLIKKNFSDDLRDQVISNIASYVKASDLRRIATKNLRIRYS